MVKCKLSLFYDDFLLFFSHHLILRAAFLLVANSHLSAKCTQHLQKCTELVNSLEFELTATFYTLTDD